LYSSYHIMVVFYINATYNFNLNLNSPLLVRVKRKPRFQGCGDRNFSPPNKRRVNLSLIRSRPAFSGGGSFIKSLHDFIMGMRIPRTIETNLLNI
jgi:hypothetical protein